MSLENQSLVGEITVVIGPMFSGKTTELVRLIDRKRLADKKCLIIKNEKDNRFDRIIDNINCDEYVEKSHLTTHSEIRYNKCDILSLTELNNNTFEYICKNKYEVVGIDEGFFFRDLTDFCCKLTNVGIDVICSTLDSSYKQELFPEIGKLIAKSEHVIKINAICMRCKKDGASFTIRTIQSEEQILVGGSDIYQSVCRKCLNDFNNSC
jgi:thymidine kinase